MVVDFMLRMFKVNSGPISRDYTIITLIVVIRVSTLIALIRVINILGLSVINGESLMLPAALQAEVIPYIP